MTVPVSDIQIMGSVKIKVGAVGNPSPHGENADKVGGEVEDDEEVENGERLEDGNDDDTGTETGEGDVDDKGGDQQT